MQLLISHQTTYQYSLPSTYTIQQLRLTPRREKHQQAIQWEVQTAGNKTAFIDAYGNQSHTLTITGSHSSISILAQGIVDISAPAHGRISDAENFSPLVFTVPTRLTAATPAILTFAHRGLPRDQIATTSELLDLASKIQMTVAYRSGTTIVTSTADDALSLGLGVCQDHAHLFLACCHVRGIPARYVSGYIDPETSGHADSHAWVDVWAQDTDYQGWVSIDVTHARLMDDTYCRLAIGRDYDSAAPVRGVRRGGGTETLQVSVHVTPR
ncbi:transglutaminase family protein [Undibacterium sp. SXout11W]|uniref:transglutaminase family protein n=1 Tax=Undibacterium sp. SXout11W TaxID=3413050 RepID=UPI003BF142B4